ncbi:MAG TPA: NADH-quinone oxidoreductase subunit J [Actinobacteria bacterium]|nr:NADH-quinone oxidoreductase subunit J [Actinomycetota bacterium]
MAELVVFAVFAAVALAGAFVMLSARNPVYSAIGLLASMFSIAVFYVLLDAHFIAAIQVIIYAGAVMTLFLFVIMMIGVDRREDTTEPIPFQRPIGIVLALALGVLVVAAGSKAWFTGSGRFGSVDLVGTIGVVADELFGTWVLPFLGTTLLLTIAALATVALGRYDVAATEGEEGP